MFSSHPTSPTRKYARVTAACLAAGVLTFTAGCSVFQRPDGASEEISFGGKKDGSGNGSDSGNDKGQPAAGNYSEVSKEIDDNRLREIFKDGNFSDCDLGQDFYNQAYLDSSKVLPLDSADIFVNSETCAGFAKPKNNADLPEEVKNTSSYTALSATKERPDLADLMGDDAEFSELSDDGIKGWKVATKDELCSLSGPEGTPLENAEIMSTHGCDTIKPLLRSLTNLGNRYQELEGKEANIGGAEGPQEVGDRVELNIVDDGFLENREKAKSKDEAVTEKVGLGRTEMKLKNPEVLIDNPRDYGKFCAEVEYAYEDESPLFPPSEIGMQTPDGEYWVMKIADKTVTPMSDGKGSQHFCSEAGVPFDDTDFIIIGADTLTTTQKDLEEDGMPLWRVHVKHNDDGKYEVS